MPPDLEISEGSRNVIWARRNPMKEKKRLVSPLGYERRVKFDEQCFSNDKQCLSTKTLFINNNHIYIDCILYKPW